jgi:hypothetical protein
LEIIVKFHNNHEGIGWLALPMLVLLFSSIPWERDPRTAPPVQKLLDLRKSAWSWDKAEYERLLNVIDPNQLVEGKPLFVRFGIDERDDVLLRQFLARGANVNLSSWGCTPLMAALDADRQASKGEDLAFSELLLRAGADPNVLPDRAEVNRRLAYESPSKTCKTFDALNSAQKGSVLSVFMETTFSDSVIELLLQKGARPRGLDDARVILVKAMSSPFLARLEKPLVEIALQYGASLKDESDVAGTLFSEVLGRSSSDVLLKRLHQMLELGSDPNQRNSRGELPLEMAIGRCVAPREVFNIEQENSQYMADYVRKQWRESDEKARKENTLALLAVNTLLKGGADPNLPLNTNNTAGSLLVYAIRGCPSDVPEALVAYKAKISESAIEAAHVDLRTFLRNHVEH